MTKERAMRLAAKWANGGVCTLREGEAQEYHELCLAALRGGGREYSLLVVHIWWKASGRASLYDLSGLSEKVIPYIGDENQ